VTHLGCAERRAAARPPRRGGLLWLLFPAALASAALAGAQAQEIPAESDSLIRLGAQLYQREGCPLCHRIRGEGGTVGPALDGIAARRPDPAWYVRFLQDPAAVVQGSVMPPFGHLSETHRMALATYLLALGP